MVNQMHQKQMVIKRKYELPNKEMHPSSVWSSLDGGGFNSFSTFGGHSRLLTSHTFRMMVATSAVRPLHSSHLGDSGITNLSKCKCKLNWRKANKKIKCDEDYAIFENALVIHLILIELNSTHHKKQRKTPGTEMHSCKSRKSCVR